MEQRPPTPTETGAGYETSDVSPRGIVLLGSVLAAVTVLVSLLLWAFFDQLETRARRADPPISPLATDGEPAHGPLLETNFNHRAARKKAEDHLASYGWVDKSQKIVHVPIERAMQLMITENEKR